jgi:hypothetical protein
MVYWYDDVAHYSKAFQGFVVTIGWTMGIVGVAAYTSVFKKYSFRNFLCGLQLFQAALSTLDWFLVVYAGDVRRLSYHGACKALVCKFASVEEL